VILKFVLVLLIKVRIAIDSFSLLQFSTFMSSAVCTAEQFVLDLYIQSLLSITEIDCVYTQIENGYVYV
jgi:hypothetical protein